MPVWSHILAPWDNFQTVKESMHLLVSIHPLLHINGQQHNHLVFSFYFYSIYFSLSTFIKLITKYLIFSLISGHCSRILKIFIITLLLLSSFSYKPRHTSFNYVHCVNLVLFPFKEQLSTICNAIAFHTKYL